MTPIGANPMGGAAFLFRGETNPAGDGATRDADDDRLLSR
jgi:hypothetical protein